MSKLILNPFFTILGGEKFFTIEIKNISDDNVNIKSVCISTKGLLRVKKEILKCDLILEPNENLPIHLETIDMSKICGLKTKFTLIVKDSNNLEYESNKYTLFNLYKPFDNQ